MGVYLAVEDDVSAHVGRKLIEFAGETVAHRPFYRGKSDLRKSFDKFYNLSTREVVLLLVDLDRTSDRKMCAIDLVRNWLVGRKPNPQLIFRVAVHEVESWLMADHDGLEYLLGLRARTKLPSFPDRVEEPKELLLSLVKSSRKKELRDCFKSIEGRLSPGLTYSTTLCRWIDAHWSPKRAAEKSDSLKRAIIALQKVCGGN